MPRRRRRQGASAGDIVGGTEGGSSELDAGQRRRRGVGQVGADGHEETADGGLDDQRPHEHGDDARQLGAEQRADAGPDCPKKRCSDSGAGDVSDEGARSEGHVVTVSGYEGEPDSGGDEAGDESEDGTRADCGQCLGDEHPSPVRGPQVGEGGGVVAVLAAGDDHP